MKRCTRCHRLMAWVFFRYRIRKQPTLTPTRGCFSAECRWCHGIDALASYHRKAADPAFKASERARRKVAVEGRAA